MANRSSGHSTPHGFWNQLPFLLRKVLRGAQASEGLLFVTLMHPLGT